MTEGERDALLLPAESLVAGMTKVDVDAGGRVALPQRPARAVAGAADGECAVFSAGDFLGIGALRRGRAARAGSLRSGAGAELA